VGPEITLRERCARQAGLTLAELLVVVSIVGVVAGLSLPNLSRAIDNARLKGATQQLVALYQDARLRATQNNASYEVLVSSAGIHPAQACIDIDGDGKCGATDPGTLFAGQVVLNNIGVPLKLGKSELGFDRQKNTENSSMVDGNNELAPGLAWNARGIPCERTNVITSPCLGIEGWVQYLQLTRVGRAVLYAAVTVSPTGRVKTWTYVSSSDGNGSWQ
jgi:prepilin-type N-terminal cleavage/methylation domain-containing protein